MNHDATHCFNHTSECPKTCYRAQLTEELKNIHYPFPVSWASFKGTDYCPIGESVIHEYSKDGSRVSYVDELLNNRRRTRMARMSDEAYDYYQDCKEKKFTGTSARSKRGHTGKRGGMRTASDYMTKKELRALDGEVKTYRLGSPMSWEEFNAMPDDLKKMYIKNLRKKFNVPDEVLAVSMGGELTEFAKRLKTIGLGSCSSADWANTDDCGRFGTWWIVTKEEK